MAQIDHDFGNKTKYGIENDALRYIWAGYHLFLTLSSLIGDTTILVASIKYKAFNLHEVVVVIVQHIATSDLMLTIITLLVTLVSILADKWVFGLYMCFLTVYADYYCNFVNILLISVMTTSKLLLLTYPLRFGNTSSKKAHIICGCCWAAALFVPAICLLINWDDVYFSYRAYQCALGFTAPIWRYLRPILAVICLLAPTCLVVATSVYLLVIARKIARNLRQGMKWQGIITTIVIAAVFCVSMIPYLVFRIFNLSSGDSVRVASSFMPLNIVSNFYIYSLTVTSFRNFILTRLQILFRMFTKTAVFSGLTITIFGEGRAAGV